jgi:two-component system response regulator YesN
MQNCGMNLSDSGTSPVRILVVDDYPNTAVLLARSISRLTSGIEVYTATSAFQALKCAQDGVPNILITDMDMPEMTGLELIEKLQDHPLGSPIVSILITASQAPELNIRARHLNIREVLQKPAHPERVCQIVSQILQERERELS